jgi:hypothetical protein
MEKQQKHHKNETPLKMKESEIEEQLIIIDEKLSYLNEKRDMFCWALENKRKSRYSRNL